MKAADLSAGHAGRGLWAVGWRGRGARWRGLGQMLAAGADALRWGVRRGDDPRVDAVPVLGRAAAVRARFQPARPGKSAMDGPAMLAPCTPLLLPTAMGCM